MLIPDLVAEFNIVARTEYNKAYQSFEPQFSALMFEYQSGPVETMNFPFFEFLHGMEEFTGSRTHKLFPEGYKFQVVNKEWDMAVDIRMKDLDRAAQVSSLNGLNPYKTRIAELPRIAKDHPVELAFEMLEAGDANTYGTCFDGQNLFDTTHSYSLAAGTQSNIVTGTGTTVDQIHADVLSALSRLNGFYFNQGGTTNAKKRKLNPVVGRFLIVAPDELYGQLYELQTKSRLASSGDNTLLNRFDFVTRPFTDANDYYVCLVNDPTFRPFLYQIEKAPMLDVPNPNDESMRERKVATWGVYGRYNVAYGAWWKTVQVTNT